MLLNWATFPKNAARFAIALGIIIVVWSAYVSTLDPTGLGLLDNKWREFWIKIGSVSALILIVVTPLWNLASGDGHLKSKVISEKNKDDLKTMAEFMKDADDVLIYSGDFSYIYDHTPLYNTLLDLAERENLRFISYKSSATVTAMSQQKRGQRKCLITELINRNNVVFDVSGKAKFSLIKRRGEEVLLYRHREENVDYVTVFKATNGMAKQIVRNMEVLTNAVVKP